MRDKILVEVMLPATQGRYEFYVPVGLTVYQGAQIISRMLEARVRPCYTHSDSCELMLLEGTDAGELLDREATFGCLAAQDRLVPGMKLALL